MLTRLEEIFSDVYQVFEVDLREMNGEINHLHLLIEYPPKVQLSKLINSLKGVSSRHMRNEFPVIHRYLWKGAPSYFAGSCGGANLSVIKTYIEQQNRPE